LPTGKSQRKKRKNNKPDKILKAAVKLVLRKGYYQTHISEIASKAGVSPYSIYYYFGGKEEVLLHLREKTWKDFSGQMNRLAVSNGLDPLEKLDAVIDCFRSQYSGDRENAYLVFNEHTLPPIPEKSEIHATRDQVYKSLKKILRDGLKEQFMHDGTDPALFTTFFISGLTGVLGRWAENPKDIALDELTDGLKHQLKHGIIKW